LVLAEVMTMGLRGYVGGVFVAVCGLALASGPQREKSLWAAESTQSLRDMETAAASRTGDADAVRALAQAYLDAGLPGLAVGLVERASPRVRTDLRVRHVYARALVDDGRSEAALAEERAVLGECTPDQLSEVAASASGRPASGNCDPVLFASAVRRVGILRELVSLGVQDAQAHPEEALLAYQNATREAHVMVQ
jgi:hypothetical protein